MKRPPRFALALFFLPLCVGCARYYRVTDPATRDVYYTRDVDKRDSGAAEFTDAKTGAAVTLQSSVIQRIPKAQFVEVIGTK